MSSTSKPEIVKTETTSLKTNYIIYQLHTYKNSGRSYCLPKFNQHKEIIKMSYSKEKLVQFL